MSPVVLMKQHLPSNRNLALLTLGQGISRLGDGLYITALTWTAWSLAHTSTSVTMVLLAAYIPMFLISLLGASLADRYSRKCIMIASDALRAILLFILALLIYYHVLTLTNLTLLVGLVSFVGAPFVPARNAIVTQVVAAEKLLFANGLLQVSFRSAFFVGPLFFAPLLHIASLPGVFACNALTFLCSILTLLFIRTTPLPTNIQPLKLWADLHTGWKLLRRAPDVQITIANFVLAIFLTSGFLSVGLIDLVKTHLHGDAGSYGLLLGISGLAEVGGALVLSYVPLRNIAFMATFAWAIVGLFRFPLGLVSTIPVAAVLLTATGLISAVTDLALFALIQKRIPGQHLAKVFGLWEAGNNGAIAVAPLLASFVIDHAGTSQSFIISGIAVLVMSSTSCWIVVCLQRGNSRKGKVPR